MKKIIISATLIFAILACVISAGAQETSCNELTLDSGETVIDGEIFVAIKNEYSKSEWEIEDFEGVVAYDLIPKDLDHYYQLILLKIDFGEKALNDAMAALRNLYFVETVFPNYTNYELDDDLELICDINNDGKENARDVICIMKYLVGEDVDIVLKKADFNGDGKVNAKDVIDMMKYIVNG